MQTALVEASNPNETTFMETRLLLDTGSQRSYITKDLSEKLSLREVGKETLTVYTFENKKPKEITTPIVDVGLKTTNGETLTIRASVVPHITGTVQRSPINSKQRKKLQNEFRLSDTLPNSIQSSKLGLLIGNDYYQDIVLPEREKLEDGIYAIKSRFGWILSGRTPDNNEKIPETSMFVMTNTSSKQLSEMQAFTHIDSCQDVKPDIEALWKLDTLGIDTNDKKKTITYWKPLPKQLQNKMGDIK